MAGVARAVRDVVHTPIERHPRAEPGFHWPQYRSSAAISPGGATGKSLIVLNQWLTLSYRLPLEYLMHRGARPTRRSRSRSLFRRPTADLMLNTRSIVDRATRGTAALVMVGCIYHGWPASSGAVGRENFGLES